MSKPSEHFNTAANTWDTDETINRTAVFAEAIKKHLGDQKITNLLDLGCGTGLLAEHFLAQSSNILGIDTSEGMLEKFKLRFNQRANVKSLAINLEKDSIPETEPKLDVVVSSMAFHHLKEPKKILQLLKKHLASSGKIFIIDLDKEDGTFHPDNKAMGVEHFGFSKHEFEEWSSELGFEVFTHEIIFEINKNNRSYGVGLAIFEKKSE